MAKKTGKRQSAAEKATGGGKSLVIVESPAKAKTITKYLGRGYVVKASKGHVRDLPEHRYGIDPGRNFEPQYEILPSRAKVIDELRHHAAAADAVYLATDLDREGEAIAWHLAMALELPPEKTRRVVFNEITRTAIAEAFEHPHRINMEKVEAQQARRILDRVVGYELSPLLWKKVAKGLSAGRVQSVAVRMIVEREHEIRVFEPEEYWAVEAVFTLDAAKVRNLAAGWAKLNGHDEAGESDATVRQRMAWLSENGCFEASLVEVNGEPFRPVGTLKKVAGDRRTFTSAVEQVRPLVEALGFRIEKVETVPWEDYARLGLSKVRLVGRLDHAAAPPFSVRSIETKRTRTKPSAPFTTASMQQASVNQLRFDTSRTMRVAQSLYEGLDIGSGEGPVGLITYMRTDSTNLSAESVHAVREFITKQCGDKYVPDKPNRYTSAKQAQEAHEAIRPTDVTRTPEALRGHMTDEQHKLYTLIWNRFVASQMTPAEWDSTTAMIAADTPRGAAVFKAAGRVLVFDGFYRVMGVPRGGEDQILPALTEKQALSPVAVEPTQKYTAPPPRYTEASLVKSLESEGIGRPSTYASIIKTIQDRGYVEQRDRRFHATHRGEVVTRKLVEHFPKVMDVGFTSHVEDQLDKIEEKHLDWHAVLHEFYDPFKESLAKAHEEMQAVRAEPSEYVCSACGKEMVYRLGKKGRFLSCTGYPECTETRDVDENGKMIEPVVVDIACERCGRPMKLRRSRRGPFLGCTGYPDCDMTMPCDEAGKPLRKVRPEELHDTCPDCGATMNVKFARGRAFLGCTGYPKCKTTKPVPADVFVVKPPPEQAGAACDKCGRPMVIRKSRRGPFLSCSGFPRCRNAMSLDKLDHLKEKAANGEIPHPPAETGNNGQRTNRKAAAGSRGRAKTKKTVDPAELGPPPKGFAWTRTGRPVVETWPEEPLSCPNCSGVMTLRTGRFGPFFSCGECREAVNLRGAAKKRAEAEVPAPQRPKPIPTDVACPECGAKMILRMGKTGRFLGCSGYPGCRKTMEAPPGLLREVAATADATT